MISFSHSFGESLTNDIAIFFRDSPKRYSVLDTTVKDLCFGVQCHLQPLCPTRWTVLAKALKALLTDYKAVLEALDILSDESGLTEAKASGFFNKLMLFVTYFTLFISQEIFYITEQFATSLQQVDMNITDAITSAESIITTLKSQR